MMDCLEPAFIPRKRILYDNPHSAKIISRILGIKISVPQLSKCSRTEDQSNQPVPYKPKKEVHSCYAQIC